MIWVVGRNIIVVFTPRLAHHDGILSDDGDIASVVLGLVGCSDDALGAVAEGDIPHRKGMYELVLLVPPAL